jgi:hypothetical protein
VVGALVTAAAAASALTAYGGRSEGTVVAKTGATVTGPVAVPVWGTCSVPECWRLVVRDIDGNTFEPCVSREEYDRTQLGAYRHGRTDR